MPDMKKIYTPSGSGATVVKGKPMAMTKGASGATGNKPAQSDGQYQCGASNQRRLK